MPLLPVKRQQGKLLRSRRVTWLASYPRSGNTLLRLILHLCLGLFSASIFPEDVEKIRELEERIGHVEYGPRMDLWMSNTPTLLVKTHLMPTNDQPAIYVVRDGRAACVSMWEFYRRAMPLETFLSGSHYFGSWAQHIATWHPLDRPNSLLIKYETMVEDLPTALQLLSRFLGVPIINDRLPDRDELARVTGGRWIRQGSHWQSVLGEKELRLFDEVNGAMMRALGYYTTHDHKIGNKGKEVA